MNKKLGLAMGLLACLAAESATAAQTLSGTITADDAFNAYLSTSDASLGTLLTSSTFWGSPGSFSATLSPGTTYYLHIQAWDLYGAPSGLLGSLNLSGTGGSFSNGTQALATDTSHWNVSLSGFGSGYVSPYGEGTNGVAPWGSFAGIASNAQWIWTGTPGQVGVSRYFSTTIAAVPEPETWTLLMAGLAVLLLAGRRRQILVRV